MKYVAEACGGDLLQGSPEALVARVCTDSRQAQAGDLFFALSGERFDGHNFVAEVARKNVAAVVVNRQRLSGAVSGAAVIAVENPRQALGALAARYRRDFDLPVVAVGGSNGKTTTKELLAAVLAQKFVTLRSEASFNNDVGVPVTLLQLEARHRAAVLEVGTNHPGELAPLVRMVRPRFGVITSIGNEHLEFFGDLAGVALEEGWLAELLPGDGKLFVNGDSAAAAGIVARTSARVERAGCGADCDWRADDVRVDFGGTKFRVMAARSEFNGEYWLQLLGRHQAVNALLALAVGAELGLDREQLQRGLAACPPPKMRLQTWQVNGVRVLDDAYNANADSMRAALQTLRDLPCAGRRVAVLGDMGELGRHGCDAHEQVGRWAAELGVEQLFAVGSMAAVMVAAARAAGLKETTEIGNVEEAAEMVKRFVKPGDLVLFKASRAARLERIGNVLRSSGEQAGQS